MIDLNPESISKDIFGMLTRDSQPPALDLEWRSVASSYLDTCKVLFSKEHKRCRCFDSFQKMGKKIGPDNESQISIKFMILFEDEAEYLKKIREYLSDSLKSKFNTPGNVIVETSGKSSIDNILDSFEDPIQFSPVEVKSVIEYVRNLDETARNRTLDLCQLARLWTKSNSNSKLIVYIVDMFNSLVGKGYTMDRGLVPVFFDMLYMLDDSKRCLDTLTTGMINVCVEELYEECKKNIQQKKFNTIIAPFSSALKVTAKEYKKYLEYFRTNVLLKINDKIKESPILSKESCLAGIGLALFNENNEREPVIKSLAETLEQDIKEFSSEKWIRTFLDACISERPPDMIGRVYFFNLLYQTIISDNPRDKDIDFLSSKCQKYFLQGNMNGLVDEIFKWIISSGKKLDICLQKTISVSKVYGCEHPYRMLFDNFCKYKLFQEDNQERFIRITFKLLHSMTYIDPIERINCQKEIEELLLKDTIEFKAVSSDDAGHNVDVIREVIHKFQSVQYSKKVPNDIYIEVVTLLNRALKTCSKYAAQQTDLAVAQKDAMQEIASYGLKTKDGLFQTEVTEERARALYESGLIRTQVTVTDSNGVRLWHVSKDLIGTKITDDTLSDILKRDRGEFIRTIIRPWRDTFYQYCRFPEWNWYIFVEGHWYPHSNENFVSTATNPRLIYITSSSQREGNHTHYRIRIEAENPGNEEAAWGGVTINVPSITSKDIHDNTKIQAWSSGCDKDSSFWRLPGEKISGFRDDGSFGEIQTQCLFIESCVTSWKPHHRISLEAELTVPVHFTSLEIQVRTWATWKKSDGKERTNGDPDWNDKKKVLDQQRIPAYSITIS